MNAILAVLFLVSYFLPSGGTIQISYTQRGADLVVELDQPGAASQLYPIPGSTRPDRWYVSVCHGYARALFAWGDNAIMVVMPLETDSGICTGDQMRAVYLPLATR